MGLAIDKGAIFAKSPHILVSNTGNPQVSDVSRMGTERYKNPFKKIAIC